MRHRISAILDRVHRPKLEMTLNDDVSEVAFVSLVSRTWFLGSLCAVHFTSDFILIPCLYMIHHNFYCIFS
jgi:hypothetical protein